MTVPAFAECERGGRRKGKVDFMKWKNKGKFRVLSILAAFVMAFTLAGGNSASVQAKKNSTVILYFSATGTTESIAKKIKKNTKGKLIEVKAKDPYTEEDLDWGEEESRVTTEHESADSPAESSVRPEIKNMKAIKKAVKKADIVYIGYPIWWGEAPHIIYNLVETVSLEGKTVVPFCTSMSSGLGESSENLKGNAVISDETDWLAGRNFYGRSTQKKVNQWIKSLGY